MTISNEDVILRGSLLAKEGKLRYNYHCYQLKLIVVSHVRDDKWKKDKHSPQWATSLTL